MSTKNGWICLMVGLIFSCTTAPGHSSDGDTVVNFEKTFHFPSVDGEDLIVQPGWYQVMQSGSDSLWLIGEDQSTTLLLAAEERTNEEPVTQPEALTFLEAPDDVHLLLLLPDGKGLETVGSLSEVRSKGAGPVRQIASTRVSQGMKAKAQMTLKLSVNPGLTPNLPKILNPEMELIEIWRFSPPNAAPGLEKLFAMPPPNPTVKPHLKVKPNLPWIIDGWDVDGPNEQFFFVWKPIPKPPAPGPFQKDDDTPGPVSGGGNPPVQQDPYWRAEVRINGQKVPLVGQFGLQFSPGGKIITRPLLDPRPSAWPITVSLLVETKQGKLLDSAASTVQVGKIWSWFERTLWPIFTHTRCTSCHSVGDTASILKYHQDRGVNLQQFVVSSVQQDVKPHNPGFCVGCHGIVTNEWFSPAFVQGVNWTVAMPPAKGICEKVTGPFTDKNGKVGPPLDLQYHFHHDPRIVWAVSDGTVPMGKPKKPVLFPGKKEIFFYKIDQWLNKGKPCPKTTAMDGL